MTRPCVWDDLPAQTRVASFLRRAATGDTVAHAYLFVGPTGSGKRTAALALACALFCDDNGCGSCPVCYRVKNGFHPDVHSVRPEGAATYMVEQIRNVIRDVHLKPIQASRKIYIFDEAERLDASSANALLKTLEEPPDNVVIALLARSYDSVLPTIVSRCQVVRFRPVPPSVARSLLIERTGATPEQAAAVLAAAGGVVARAEDILGSSGRLASRDLVMRTLKQLPVTDAHDVLTSAREVLAAFKAPLDDLKAAQADELEEQRSVLGGKVSTTDLEKRHKRELTAREREGIAELFGITESWLRDCLIVSQSGSGEAANADVADAIEEIARVITPRAALAALEAVRTARSRISYNVSPQLAIEAMLFDIQEVLRCPR